MTLAISTHDKRVLMIGAGALAIIVAGPRLCTRALAWNAEARGSAASLVAELQRERTSIRALPITRESLVVQRVTLMGLDSTILEGEASPLAGAALAEVVSDVAEATKTQLANLQVHTDSLTGTTFLPVQVQVSVTGDWESLVRFIAHLENGQPTVVLRALSVSASLDQNTGPGKPEVMRADLLIEALGRNQRPHASTRR